MKDKEGVKVVVLARSGKASNKVYKLSIYPDNTATTTVAVSRLIKAMVTKLELADEEYELFVKMPSEKPLNILDFDSLDTLLLLPLEPEEIFS